MNVERSSREEKSGTEEDGNKAFTIRKQERGHGECKTVKRQQKQTVFETQDFAWQ